MTATAGTSFLPSPPGPRSLKLLGERPLLCAPASISILIPGVIAVRPFSLSVHEEAETPPCTPL